MIDWDSFTENDANVREVMEYQRTKDKELCSDIIRRFEPFIRANCRKFFLPGQDQEDLLQEARLGFFKAIRDFNPERHPVFVAFAVRCIKGQCISALKGAQRMKQRINYTAWSLDVPVFNNNSEFLAIDLIIDERSNPERDGTNWDCYRSCDKILRKNLSPNEYNVLKFWLSGYTYQDVALLTKRTMKSVDNTLQRIRRKLMNLDTLHPGFQVQFLGFLREKEQMEQKEAQG